MEFSLPVLFYIFYLSSRIRIFRVPYNPVKNPICQAYIFKNGKSTYAIVLPSAIEPNPSRMFLKVLPLVTQAAVPPHLGQ